MLQGLFSIRLFRKRAVEMKSYRGRDSTKLKQIAQVCLAWLSLGAVAGAYALSSEPVDPDSHRGVDIERAVAQAEAQAEAARAASPLIGE